MIQLELQTHVVERVWLMRKIFMRRVCFCVWDCTQLVEDASTLQLGLLSNLACYERDVSLWYKRYFTVSDAGLLFPHGMSFISLSVFLRRVPLCALLVLFGEMSCIQVCLSRSFELERIWWKGERVHCRDSGDIVRSHILGLVPSFLL